MRALVRTSLVWSSILLLAMVTVRAEETLRIVPFSDGNRVFVSFELNDAYDDAVRDAIASGLRTTFTYELELRTRAWVDRTIGTTVVAMTDRYDNLARHHTLTRTVDGRVDDVLVTEDDAVEELVHEVEPRAGRGYGFARSDAGLLCPRHNAHAADRPIAARTAQDHHRSGQVHLHPVTSPGRAHKPTQRPAFVAFVPTGFVLRGFVVIVRIRRFRKAAT